MKTLFKPFFLTIGLLLVCIGKSGSQPFSTEIWLAQLDSIPLPVVRLGLSFDPDLNDASGEMIPETGNQPLRYVFTNGEDWKLLRIDRTRKRVTIEHETYLVMLALWDELEQSTTYTSGRSLNSTGYTLPSFRNPDFYWFGSSTNYLTRLVLLKDRKMEIYAMLNIFSAVRTPEALIGTQYWQWYSRIEYLAYLGAGFRYNFHHEWKPIKNNL